MSLYENDVEFYNDRTPRPREPLKSTETLQAEMLMWKARAMQNRAEIRELRNKLDALQKSLRKARNEAARYRTNAQEAAND